VFFELVKRRILTIVWISTCRGYASLKSAAVHVDHNHRLVDIDTGAEIFHFKVGSRSDFRLWTAVIEKHAESKSSGQGLADGAPGSQMNINGNVATEMDSDAKEMNAYLARILSSLSGEIERMRHLVEASRGRIDSKSSWKGNQLLSSIDKKYSPNTD
jgi:hypothetical protein